MRAQWPVVRAMRPGQLTCPGRCNVPYGPCSCRLESLYTRLEEDKRTDLAKVPFSRNAPLAVKHGWTALRKLQQANSG